jgi:small-conductance mechanosensitive channel
MKSARYTALLVSAFALPYLFVGIFAGGPNASRTLQAGLLMVVAAGAVIGWLLWRRKKVDPEQDEREDYLLLRATAFSFYVMLVAVGTYVLWPLDATGHAIDAGLWLSAALWGSFLIGYVYSRIRH